MTLADLIAAHRYSHYECSCWVDLPDERVSTVSYDEWAAHVAAVIEAEYAICVKQPHHWMNAGGLCHAGDMFEQGTPYIALYANGSESVVDR